MVNRLFTFIRNRLKPGSKNPPPGQNEIVAAELASPDKPVRKKRRRPPKKKTGQSPQEIKRKPQATHSDWNPASFTVTPEEGKSRFHDFELPSEIMHAVADLNFQYCTPIQAASMPHTLKGLDTIGKAQTGTGKTAAFLITIIVDILKNRGTQSPRPAGAPHSLIIAPTRELVIQIAKDAEDLGKYAGIKIVSVYGGIDYQKQQNKLIDKSVDLIVATPGRLLDFQRNKIINLSKVRIMVIDEADRMLDMGFIPDVRRIVNATPPKDQRQTLFYSATITPEVNHLASQWTKNPVTVEIEPEQVAVDTVKQLVYLTTTKEKYNLLYNTIINGNLERVIVFTTAGMRPAG